MQIDHEHESGLCERHQVRKEWRRSGEAQHQMEAREHARQRGASTGKSASAANAERARSARPSRHDAKG